MREVIVFAEGPTEERFIKQLVAPALHGLQIYLKPQLLKTSQSGRGGALSIDRFLLNARNTLRQKPNAVLSSFIDLYGLDTDFPAYEESQKLADVHQRVALLEQALHRAVVEHVGCRADRFLPHIQPYEYEGLLFSDVDVLAATEPTWGKALGALRKVRDLFDSPDLIACCVVGDGEAETGPLATSWHSNKFLDPVRDGAVLPILHLNGYKIASPTVLARIPRAELESLLIGYGYAPMFVEGDQYEPMHQAMAAAFDQAIDEIHAIQRRARLEGATQRPRWPMIVLVSPKGWTGPEQVDGLKTEDYWRSHQVPFSDMDKPEYVRLLEDWMRSYRPEELFDADGRLIAELADLAPQNTRRMGANLHANGGLLLRDLHLPDFTAYAVDVPQPGAAVAESTRVMGTFLRDVMRDNGENFRVFGPDEINSNRLGALFEVTNRAWMAERFDYDDHLAADGRVMEILSEHTCQGWLEGYLLTGRHGLFTCYEAFIHIVDSMFNQHAKWLKVCNGIPWRRPIASLNILLTSHVWRQDHNGFSHQDPGFIDHVVNKKADIIRVYLPPDANTLLCVSDQCLRSRNLVNVIVAGKQPGQQWLNMNAAINHTRSGIGLWEWACNDQGGEPDIVLVAAGDVPTLEMLAAIDLLRQLVPELKMRFINVVDLMTLQPREEHPHGLSDRDFDSLFTTDKPILFAYHGYPWLIHRLTYRRLNHANLHVRGYKEEGTTTTPFDMTVLNNLDRFHLVMDVMDQVPKMHARAAHIKQQMRDRLSEHTRYIEQYGEDQPEIRHWKWPAREPIQETQT